MMKDWLRTAGREEGQSLVFMALAMVGLMAFLGLAIDGGNIYLQRRNVQNAADGAALAGAVAMAQHVNGGLTTSELCAAVTEYAAERHLADADMLQIYYAPRAISQVDCNSNEAVPTAPTVNGITVVAGRNFRSFITQVIGQDAFTVRATATAQFGAAKSVNGLQPIAVHTSMIPSQRNDPNNIFHIWTDDKGTPGANDITGAGRGWVDLDCNYPEKCNHSENDIKAWMKDGYKLPVAEKYNLQSAPGVRAASLQDPYVYPGKILLLPVYDYARKYTSEQKCNPNSKQYDPGPGEDQCHDNPAYGTILIDTYTNDHSLSGTYYYHVVSFGAFHVTGVTAQGSNKAISGYFVDYVADGELGGSDFMGITVIKMTR